EERSYCQNERKDEVILRVNTCAVCTYDVRVVRGGHIKVRPPVILGHELCATTEGSLTITDRTISKARTSTTIIKADSRVAVCPIVPCLYCLFCSQKKYNLCIDLKEIGSSLDGGFAEYIVIPQRVLRIGGIVSVPNNLSDDEAALLEPLACCLNGFSNMGQQITKETTVTVIGDGPIGLLHLQISKKLYDARTMVVGKIPHRIEIAKLLGADAIINNIDTNNSAKDILNLTNGIGSSIIIIATSDPAALRLALSIASKGSIINIFAGIAGGNHIFLDPNWLHYNQVAITGSFSSTPHMLQQAARLASYGKINLSRMVSHRYSLNEVQEALLATEKYYGLRAVINDFE
ncbi:MAG: alcohol dehydrogenase catalytic domain-containing protein, partial [Candidatus Nitrosopolaris sp.]